MEMEVFSVLKFWRNRAPQVNEDSFDLAVAYPQCDLDKVVTKKDKKSSSIVINTSVGITSLDKDTSKQFVHQNLSKIDGRANAIALNADVFSLDKLQTNFKSPSSVLVLRSSRVSMLRFKKSSSLEKAEINCTITSSMATPKREQSSSCKSKREKSENSSSNKVFKLVKQASKIRIFDQSVSGDGEKQKGNGAAVFTQVCRSLTKSKSSARTVPVPVCRRDDSALQQQDGIQSAILHCKRSYSSSSSSSSFSTISQECTGMSRCASESSHRKAAINPQNISPAEREMK